MGVRSDPAGALNEMLCIPWIPPLKNQLNPPEHLPGAPGIFHLAAFYLYLDTKVAFYSCNRINRYSFTHMSSPPILKRIIS
jgi:hypothetical protein